MLNGVRLSPFLMRSVNNEPLLFDKRVVTNASQYGPRTSKLGLPALVSSNIHRPVALADTLQ